MVIKAKLMGLKMTEVPDHFSVPMAARALRTCCLTATAGGICASCFCIARAGSSFIPEHY